MHVSTTCRINRYPQPITTYSMIFKTFDSDIDKWSSKIGIFGKSFNELRTAINDAFKSVIDNLDNFDENVGFWESLKNNLFSKPADKDWIKNSFGDIISKENIDSYIKELDSESAKEKLADIFDWENLVENGEATWGEYFETLKDGTEKYIPALIKNTDDLSKLTGEDLVDACDKARRATIAHNEQIKNMSFSAKASKVAFGAFRTVMSAVVMIGISKGIELISKGIDNLVHSAEHCKERVAELMSSYQSALDEANNTAKTVESFASKYETLSKGVNNLGQNVALTTEEYAEYNDIVNQIADMFPHLIQGYTEEGTAILSLKGNVEQLRDAYKEAQQEAYSLVINGEDSDGSDIIQNWKNLNETGFWADVFDFGADDVGGGISMQDATDQLKAISEMSAETYRNIENAIGAGTSEEIAALTEIEQHIGYGSYIGKTLSIDANVTDEEFEEARKKAKTLAQTYQAELDSALQNVKTLANAYLVTNEDYAQLDESAKNAASIVVNSINTEIANGFDSKESVGSYVTEIVDLIKEDPGIHDALTGLFTLDTSDMPVEQAKTLIDTYIEAIAEKLEETPMELKARLGFDDIDTIAADYETVMNRAAAKFSGRPGNLWGGGKSLDAVYLAEREALEDFAEKHSINTQDEIAFWNQCLEESDTREEAMEKYLSSSFVTADSSTPLSITQTVDQISTRLKSAFGSLQSAYQEIFTLNEDTGEKQFASLDEVDITDKFQPILDALQNLAELDGVTVDYSAYENFVSVLSDTSSTAEEVQEQFDRLATDIIYTSDCTSMSAETFNLLAESLSEMGVSNAYEALNSILTLQQALADEGINVQTAMSGETEKLKDLTFASDETAERLMAYYIQKQLAQNPLGTLDDILQLESLCNALGITGEMLETVTALKLAFEAKESGAHAAGLDESMKAYQEKLAGLASGYGTFSFDFNAADTKSSSISGPASSSKAAAETLDLVSQAIEHVEKEIKELDETANSSYSTFSEKNEAFAQEIRKVSEEIDLQQQAYENYIQKADAVGLSDHYRALVENGASVMEDISDEALKNQISEYQKWYDKAQDVSKAIRSLKTDMKELYVQVYELQTERLKDRLDSESITHKQYLAGLKEVYKKFFTGLEDFAEQHHAAVLNYLTEEKNYLNSVANAAASLADAEIDKIKDHADEQESMLQKQIDLLEAKKKPLQEELDALDDKAKRENLILNLQKAQYELARSENQRTSLVYQNGQMVYTSNSEDIRNAQKGVDDAALEIQKQSIQDQIDALDDEIHIYQELIDHVNNMADAQIDALEKVRSKWQEVIDQREYAANVSMLTDEFGANAIPKILAGYDDDLLSQWKTNYISTLAGIDMESQGYIGSMTQQIASLYNVDLSPLQSQFQNVTTSISGVTDALGKAASAVGNGINAPVYEQKEGEPSSTNGSLSDSITGLGIVSSQTLPNVTSGVGAVEDAAINAASEVSHIADAIDSIPESKDVTISIHTTGDGHVSGGISSNISQIGYTGVHTYAAGTKLAKKGLAIVGEEKPEVVVTNDKKAFLAEQPTLLHMKGGETVFDGDETARMLKAKGFKPLTPEKSLTFKTFSQFTPEEISQRFSFNPPNPAGILSSSVVQNAGSVNNSSINKPSFTLENVHIHCPGVTKDEVAKQIGAELNHVFNGMSLKAYQRVNITR